MSDVGASPGGRAPDSATGDHAHAPRSGPGVPDAAYTDAAGLFRAAGDPERLRLLAHLSGGEWCVTELAAHAGVTLSTVSQRLRVLRNAGLVRGRRDGKHVYYSLADDHVAEFVDQALAHAADQH